MSALVAIVYYLWNATTVLGLGPQSYIERELSNRRRRLDFAEHQALKLSKDDFNGHKHVICTTISLKNCFYMTSYHRVDAEPLLVLTELSLKLRK